LSNLLKQHVEIQHCLEWEKLNLAHWHDFNLEDAFRFFDLEGKGFILSSEIRNGILDLGLKVDWNLLCLFVRRYDQYNDGRLWFEDFCNALTP